MAKKILTTFKGLNNTSDPLELGNSWLTTATNLNITNACRVSTRDGLEKNRDGLFSGAFSTKGGERMFVVNAGVLEERDAASGAYRPLVAGLSSSPMRWAELNKQIFFNNGTDAGIVDERGRVLPLKFDAPPPPRVEVGSGSLEAGLYRACCTFLLDDGRETGSGDVVEVYVPDGGSLIFSEIPQAQGADACVYIAPANSTVFQLAFEGVGTAATWSLPASQLGIELQSFALSSLPDGADEIVFWRGSLYASMHSPADGLSVVWFSKPLQFHLFDLAADYVVVKGRVNQLVATDAALVIGTDWRDGNAIYAYALGDGGGALTELASYGTVDGQNAVADDDGTALFLTCRGPARAMPYELLAPQVSFAPGLSAGGGFIERDGDKRYVFSMIPGGSPWNAWRGR